MREGRKLLAREILLPMWKIHILHHAGQEPVYGQWLLDELRRHGHRLSPGTLYPLLARLERNGWLRSRAAGGGPRARRYYWLTGLGRRVLRQVRHSLDELQRELREGT